MGSSFQSSFRCLSIGGPIGEPSQGAAAWRGALPSQPGERGAREDELGQAPAPQIGIPEQ